MKRLSVIIPGYNAPKEWWRRCVASVLNAVSSEDEIIIVDDGSRDELRVDRIAWDDLRVKVLTKPNGGLSDARNFGVARAQGRYIAFVDCDDEVRPEAYSRTIEMMEQTDSDIGIFGVNIIWVQEGLQKHDIPEDKIYGALRPQDVADLQSMWLFNYACNKVYRRDVVGIFDKYGMPAEDLIFNLERVVEKRLWCAVSYEGYIYYRVNGSLLSSYKPTNIIGLQHKARIWKRYCNSDPEAAKLFENRSQVAFHEFLGEEWHNLFKLKSPYSFIGRWRWLKAHPELGGALFFVRSYLRSMVRRFLYVKPIRRANIRKLCKGNVEEWRE